MAEHEELYDDARAERLKALLRRLADLIQQLDRTGVLLDASAELQRLLGEARSELFHYEVRCTYDTPEIAEHRRLVEDALSSSLTLEDPEDEEPWRRPRPAD
jgi:PAS domain-containing protein